MSWIKRTYRQVEALSSQRRKQRQFIILMTIIGTFLALFQWYKEVPFENTLYVTGGVLLTWIYPKGWYIPLILWFFIGKVLGEITSTIVLGVVFYLLFFPITFVRRLMLPSDESGWVKVNEEVDYTKPY